MFIFAYEFMLKYIIYAEKAGFSVKSIIFQFYSIKHQYMTSYKFSVIFQGRNPLKTGIFQSDRKGNPRYYGIFQ